MASIASPFPPMRALITRVDPYTGKSSLWRNITREAYTVGKAMVRNIWETNQMPADNNDEEDYAPNTREIFNPNGTAVRLIDLPPGEPGIFGAMHQTESLDYGVVLKGTITMVLDDGSYTDIPEGSMVVQRGTNHAWANRTKSWVRILFVLVPARKVRSETEEVS